LLRLAGLLVLAGCSGSAGGTPGEGGRASPGGPAEICRAIGHASQPLSLVDRSLVGGPAAYAPDPSLREREAALYRSQRLRRQVAWQVAEQVLSGVPLAAPLGPAQLSASLPAWQTWHAKDDLTRMFRHLYPELSPTERAARARFSDVAIGDAATWNDGAIAENADWSLERRDAYRSAIDELSEVAGLGGIYRVAYAPSTTAHLLRSYPELLGCPDLAESLLAEPSAPSTTSPASGCSDPDPAPTPCLDGPFPSSAVLVKANWRRADSGTPLPVYDTSAAALSRRLSPDGAISWEQADGSADPGEDQIYTLRLANGNAFRLAGLHIMTKELDHWVWASLWWSPSPDEDFGADRPERLPPPFQNYKLCTVTAFAEGDADPSGGFSDDLPSLGDALSAVYGGAAAPSWCSNPYIEEGAGNAASNCVGCHQHAGTGLRSSDVLGDAERFPDHGRRLLRESFPSDYVFSATVGDALSAMFEETEDHFAGGDTPGTSSTEIGQ
jgi:hypothetical protein